MQIQQLRYFLAVAEVRHFTHAAAQLRVAQATLSKQVGALERDLGAPLFSRARGNITLTPAGEALLPLARRILADVDTARREVQDLTGLRRGRVRIGATPSLLGSLLAEALARFHSSFPGIELIAIQGGSRDLVGGLAQGELDFALIVLPLQEGDPALETLPLLREDLVIAASPSDPPPRRSGQVHITDLRSRPLVMFRRGYELRDATLAAWRNAGVEPRFAIEGGEMDTVLRFVEAGLGLAVVPSVVLPGRPGVAGFPMASPGLRRTVALARRKDVQSTRAAEEFRATLLAHIRDEASSGRLPSGVQSLLGPPDHPSSPAPLPSASPSPPALPSPPGDQSLLGPPASPSPPVPHSPPASLSLPVPHSPPASPSPPVPHSSPASPSPPVPHSPPASPSPPGDQTPDDS